MRWLPWVGLFALALGVRLLYLLEWYDTVLFGLLIGDGRGYDLWAREIAAGDWFGSEVFYQAPIYPYFLASIYRLLGAGPWAVRLVQIVLGSISCVLLALAGRRFFDERVGLVGGLLLALYAPAIYFDGLIQKGAPGLFFMTLLLWTLGEFRARRTWPWVLGAGATLGAFALTRENALVLSPVVIGWLLLDRSGAPAPRRAGRAAILLVGIALVLVPVGLRNQALGGRFLVTTSQLGPNFYIGNHAGANGRYVPLRPGRGNVRYERRDATQLAEKATGRALGPAEVSRYWLGRALGDITAGPGAWVGLMAHKCFLVWHAQEIMDTDSLEVYRDESWLLWSLGSVLHFGLLAPFAVLGLWVTRRDWRRLWLLYALAGSLALAVALFFVMARYRHPLVPILALFAAAGLSELVRLARQADWSRLARLCFVIVLAGAVCNWPLRAAVDPRTITYYSLGSALVEEGRLEESQAQFERALALDPEFVDALFKLGDVTTRLGRSEQALLYLREAVRLDPSHADAQTGLGTALLQLGEMDRAAQRYETAILHEPEHVSARNNLAVLLARQGRLGEAVPHWEVAVRIDPNDTDARANLIQVLSRLALMRAACADVGLRDGPEAVRLAQRAVELSGSQDADALIARAAAEAESGRFDAAEQSILQAIELVAPGGDERARGLENQLRLYRGRTRLRIPC